MRLSHTAFLTAAMMLGAITADAQIDARLLRFPAISANLIAFVYAGDIWVVSKTGGVANRLSTPPGEESFPRFSPDGSSIAYSADYHGNLDLYIVPVNGGTPQRITHHPAPDRMLGWYPDGASLLFATSMTSGKDRFNQLYRVAATGGLPETLPVPYGEFGAISPDGRTLAYTPAAQDFRTWKRYRGGWASDIWLFELTSQTARNLTGDPAIDGQPMWHSNTLYFLSDRDANKRSNIWAYDLDRGDLRQVTRFEEYDVRFPSIGPDDLVFECGGRLYRLDLKSEQAIEVAIKVVTDRATLLPRAEKVDGLIETPGISPSGKRAIISARGGIFTLPAEHGVVLELTPGSAAAARYPAWSPDGKTIAYFSDRSGEYELTTRPADGSGDERQVTHMGPGFRYRIHWAPDGKHVVFIDQAMRIQIADIGSGEVRTIDKALYFYQDNLTGFRVSWSADSRWIAYARDLDGGQSAIFLYDTKQATRHQVTAGFYNDASPSFDRQGKYLFLLTNRSFVPSYSDFDNTWIYANSTQVAAVPLRRDVASPLKPRNDMEGVDDKKKDDSDEDSEAGSDARSSQNWDTAESGIDRKDRDKDEPVAIDLDGFEQRLVLLPAAAGNYDRVAAIEHKLLFRRLPRTGASEEEKASLCFYDLDEREEKRILDDLDGWELATDGEKILVWRKTDYAIVEAKADRKLEKKLATLGLERTIDPVAEWQQMFRDAWRFERDFFYDPNLHGVDWPAMRERYGRLLDDAVTRFDVNFVLGEMIAELNSSHTYRGGGDLEKSRDRGVGLLGVDFTLDSGAYRIRRIVRGAPWDAEERSPLDRPGFDVHEGDYLLAVNHVPVDTSVDPWAAFQGLDGETVVLSVNSTPTREGAREVVVETLKSEYRLRHLAWIDANRRRVDELSGGRIGYVYVPDTGRGGQNELVRQLMGQVRKPGLVIDERFNSGGQIPDRFVELLARPLLNYWAVRDGVDWVWPPASHSGPKAMLINGWSGSGGDAFPLYFRARGLGPLIGTRTWGGLIGLTGSPALVDGGSVTVPTFSIYSTDGKWVVEGHGVEPDIEVVDDPARMARGEDPQLERAVSEVLRALEAHPPVKAPRPPYPDRRGR